MNADDKGVLLVPDDNGSVVEMTLSDFRFLWVSFLCFFFLCLFYYFFFAICSRAQ